MGRSNTDPLSGQPHAAVARVRLQRGRGGTYLRKILGRPLGEACLPIREISHTCPGIVCGCSQDLEYFIELPNLHTTGLSSQRRIIPPQY